MKKLFKKIRVKVKLNKLARLMYKTMNESDAVCSAYNINLAMKQLQKWKGYA